MPVKVNLLSDLAAYYRSFLRLHQEMSDAEVIVSWLSYEKQSIPTRVWDVKKSTLFKGYKKSITQAVNAIETEANQGKSLLKYMSKKKNNNNFLDLLALDWGIHHFHLGNQIFIEEKNKLSKYVSRTNNLLFVYPYDVTLYFIAIMSHKHFSNIELLNIIDDNWPSISPVRRDGLLSGSELTAANIKTLRKRHINYCLSVNDGYTMLPGGGTMSNGVSLEAYAASIAMINAFTQYEDVLRNNEQRVRDEIGSFHLGCNSMIEFTLETLDQERVIPQWIQLTEQKTNTQVTIYKCRDLFYFKFYTP